MVPINSDRVDIFPRPLAANVRPVPACYAHLYYTPPAYLAPVHHRSQSLLQTFGHDVEGLNEKSGFAGRANAGALDVGVGISLRCACAILCAGLDEGEAVFQFHLVLNNIFSCYIVRHTLSHVLTSFIGTYLELFHMLNI